MTVTHVKFLDREAISNMSYFGVFNRMCVHFRLFYITHETAMIPCMTWIFVINALRHIACMATLTTIFSRILTFHYGFNMHITCF